MGNMTTIMLVAALGVGVAIGYFVWGREVEVVKEGVAFEQHQDDGSVILMRDPEGEITSKTPELPAKPVRTIEVEVLPDPVTVQERLPIDGVCPETTVTCGPVSVRLDLVPDPSGGYRAVASSEDGTVLSGIDVPRVPSLVVKQHKWAIGIERDSEGGTGLYVSRDTGRLQIGASADSDSFRARIGWRF